MTSKWLQQASLPAADTWHPRWPEANTPALTLGPKVSEETADLRDGAQPCRQACGNHNHELQHDAVVHESERQRRTSVKGETISAGRERVPSSWRM